jgi:hypothetical protein
LTGPLVSWEIEQIAPEKPACATNLGHHPLEELVLVSRPALGGAARRAAVDRVAERAKLAKASEEGGWACIKKILMQAQGAEPILITRKTFLV